MVNHMASDGMKSGPQKDRKGMNIGYEGLGYIMIYHCFLDCVSSFEGAC
jgi:hypothetical protein